MDRSGDRELPALACLPLPACLQNERSCPAGRPSIGKYSIDALHGHGYLAVSYYSPGIRIVGGRNPLLDAMIGRHEAHQAGTTSTSCLDGLHCPHAASPVNMSCRIIAVSMKGTN